MKYIRLKILILAFAFSFTACDVDYEANPNEITVPPTSGLLNDATKKMMDDFYDEWFQGRFTLVTMQYWAQTVYGDEDRYVYRESQRETWEDFYFNLENLRKVIELNTDEDFKGPNSQYGSNENQIAVARILMSWTFNIMADTWGDIPYYSYGNADPSFQALRLADVEEEILSPQYAEQSAIYADILNELQDAAAMIDENAQGVVGDNIYGGDMAAWKKFANSLRLRVALKIRGADPSTADTHINDAIAKGVFTSNADNAGFAYEAADVNAAPLYRAYNVSNRTDFAPAHSFVELLSGRNVIDHSDAPVTDNPFLGLVDPRLSVYSQLNFEGNYVGMPSFENSGDAIVFTWRSLPGDAIINTPNFVQPLMDYSEVAFILSELNGWDQTEYENGVRASMEKLGIAAADINAYMAALPAANEENVLTQKYISMYSDAHTAWSEYRRTGYPKTLILPDTEYSSLPSPGERRDVSFTSLVEGITDIPHRLQYPDFERTLNGENRAAAVSGLAKGDVLDSPLWWDVN